MAKITDNNGVEVKSMTYDSLGNIVREGGSSSGEQVSYTGRERESEFGLYYYRARYYDPLTGRFMARDPLGFAAGDVNLYRFPCAGSPAFGGISCQKHASGMGSRRRGKSIIVGARGRTPTTYLAYFSTSLPGI